jgi:hypothetical protein
MRNYSGLVRATLATVSMLGCLTTVHASPIVVKVSGMGPTDTLKIYQGGVVDATYVGPPAAAAAGAAHVFAPFPAGPGQTGTYIKISPLAGNPQPTAEIVPALLVVPPAPAPAPPGGAGGGAGGAGAGVGGAVIFDPGVDEIGFARLVFYGDSSDVAAGGSMVSFGLNSGFVASFATTPGDTSQSVLTALFSSLSAQGFSPDLQSSALTLFGGDEVIMSNTDPGLRFGFVVGTQAVPEPPSFLLTGGALLLIPILRRGRVFRA